MEEVIVKRESCICTKIVFCYYVNCCLLKRNLRYSHQQLGPMYNLSGPLTTCLWTSGLSLLPLIIETPHVGFMTITNFDEMTKIECRSQLFVTVCTKI